MSLVMNGSPLLAAEHACLLLDGPTLVVFTPHFSVFFELAGIILELLS